MRIAAVAPLVAVLLAGSLSTSVPPAGAEVAGVAAVTAAALPSFDHIVVVVEENHSYPEVIGAPGAPYLTSLAASGANLVQSYGVTHPSQPNYLALFSGSVQGVVSDSCPHTFTADNLGHQVLASGQTFAGYSEGMPSVGYTGCTSGRYARKHNPWADFADVPAAANLRFADFPAAYASLPRVSFVVPDLCDDMHDCAVSTGDTWLRTNLAGYATWAATHDSLLLVTFDEDDSSAGNRIPTVFSGAHVAPGTYTEGVDHYTVLRTLEDLTGLACLATACSRTPIGDIWN